MAFIEQLEQRTFLAAGDLDQTFGVTGLIERAFGAGDLDIFDAGIQPGDRIVVSGNFRNSSGIDQQLLLRYTATGVLDSRFAGTALVQSKPRGIDRFSQVEILPDGRILLMGEDDEVPFVPVLMRLTVSGKVDRTFGTNGVMYLQNLDHISIRRMLLQPDGKILIGGGQFGDTIHLARFHPDGAVDTSFGEDGLVVSDLGLPGMSNELVQFDRSINDLVVTADGSIILVGTYSRSEQFTSSFEDFVHPIVCRFTPSGDLDTSFANDGVVEVFQGQTITMAAASSRQVAVEPSGKIILLTWFGHLRLHRFLANGEPDTSYGDDGIVELPALTASLTTMARQADGKLLIANGGDQSTTSKLVRVLEDGSLDPNFGTDGTVEGFGGSVYLGADGSIYQVLRRQEESSVPSEQTQTLLILRRWAEEGPAGLLGAGDLLTDPEGSYRFQIEWRDDDGIDVATLSTSHLRIVGPDGTSYTVRFVGTSEPGNGTYRKAYYKFGGPGGTWDPADNGRYRVNLLGGMVEDVNGTAAPTRNLGYFNVMILSAMMLATPAQAPQLTESGNIQPVVDDLLGIGV